MKHTLTSTVVLVLLFPGLTLGETMDDLVEREGIYYKEFTDVPFTGNITGKKQGTIRNGKKVGPWGMYWTTGKVMDKGTYKDGKKEGLWISYHDNGQLWWKGTFKDGKEEGDLVYYSPDGSVSE